MKKILAMFIMLAMAAAVILLPSASTAYGQDYWVKRYKKNGRWYTTRIYKKPSFYKRHRDKVNVAIGTGAGAVIGGLIGGKKGAGIGALAGAGGSALYTYKIKPKNRKYYRVRRY